MKKQGVYFMTGGIMTTIAQSGFGTLFLVGLLLLPFAAGLLILMIWLCCLLPKHRREHYTARTVGTVERTSNISSCDIFVPLVRYSVNGQDYTVAGPRFAANRILSADVAGIELLKSTCNITPEGELPIVVKMSGSTAAAQEAMNERYPKGKNVPVFYDPKAPKHAFVERDAPMSKKLSVILIGICGLLTAVSVVMMLAGILS